MPFELSADQRYLLGYYRELYDDTVRQIDLLYTSLDNIRNNMDEIINISINQEQQVRVRPATLPSVQRPSSLPSAQQQTTQRPSALPSTQRPSVLQSTPQQYPFTNRQNIDSTYLVTFLRNFYDSVSVTASSEQISNATRQLLYREIAPTSIGASCPITLDPFTPNSEITQILPCSHIFSRHGLSAWLQNSARCPVCRCDIREYNRPQEENDEEADDESDVDNVDNVDNVVDEEETTEEEKYDDTQEPPPPNIANIINNLTSFSQMSFSDLMNNNTQYIFDPSSNQIIFETIIRPHAPDPE